MNSENYNFFNSLSDNVNKYNCFFSDKNINKNYNNYKIHTCVKGTKLIKNHDFLEYGFSENEAQIRLLQDCSEFLYFRTFARKLFIGQEISTNTYLLDTQEQYINIDNSDSLFDKNLIQRYYLDEHEFEAFIDIINSDSNLVLAIPYVNKISNENTLLPSNWVYSLFKNNGESVANSPTEAQTKSFQVIISNHIINNLLTSPENLSIIPSDLIPSEIKNLQQELRKDGKDILIFDSSLHGKYPAILTIETNNRNARIKISCAVRENLETAIKDSVLDVLKKQTWLEVTEEYSRVFTEENLVNIYNDKFGFIPVDLMKPKGIANNFVFKSNQHKDELIQLIKSNFEQNDDVFSYYELLREHNNLYFCKIIIPGFSEVTNPNNFEEKETNIYTIYRSYISNLSSTTLEELKELYESLSENNISNQILLSDLLGINIIHDTQWSDFSLGELKFLKACQLGNLDEAWNLVNEVLSTSDISPKKHSLLHCCRQLLWITLDHEEMNEFNLLFKSLYTNECVEKAKMIINGENSCLAMFNGNPEKDIADHSQLIDFFTKKYSK